MVKNIKKRMFATLMIIIMILSVFATAFGMTAYTQAATYDAISGFSSDSSSAEKPPLKKTGSYGSYAVIADYDNCLTESEETELLEILHKSAQKAKCNVGIVITKDLEGKSDEGYTNAFLKGCFGNESNSVVLMLLNRYGNPKYSNYTDVISSYGTADTKYHKKYDKMFDRIYNKMGEPIGNKNAYNNSTKTYGGYDYFNACKEFSKCVQSYGASGFAAVPMMFVNYVTGNFKMFAGGLVIAIIITLIVVKAKVTGYKKKATLSAANYIDKRATRVTRQVDQFVREYTTSHTHSSSSGGHGGGHSGGGHSSGHGRGR